MVDYLSKKKKVHEYACPQWQSSLHVNAFFAILHNPQPLTVIHHRHIRCFLSDMLAKSTVFTSNPVWAAEIECIYIDGLCVYDNFIFLK